jgi:hypothetical protein
MTLKRDHRDEHPGCKVFWPWLKWCSNYRYASQLVQMCLDDIQTMDPLHVKSQFDICKRYDDVTRYRSGVRSAYIAHREKWNEDEYGEVEASVRIMGDYIPVGDKFYEGRSYREQVDHLWFQRQQTKAVNVLYAYGMFDKSTGVIVLDKIKNLK